MAAGEEPQTLMLARTAFYYDGRHVPQGAQIAIPNGETREAIDLGLVAPIRLVGEDE